MEEELKPCPHCASDTCECFPVKDSMFQVACSECFMRSPRYASQDEAIAAWNALLRKWDDYYILPRRLRWTQEKPTVEGMYWCRCIDPCRRIAGPANIMYYTPGCTVVDMYDEFAGPIPEPEGNNE